MRKDPVTRNHIISIIKTRPVRQVQQLVYDIDSLVNHVNSTAKNTKHRHAIVKLITMFEPFDKSMKLIFSTILPYMSKVPRISRLEIITPSTPMADMVTKRRKLAAQRHFEQFRIALYEKQHIFKIEL